MAYDGLRTTKGPYALDEANADPRFRLAAHAVRRPYGVGIGGLAIQIAFRTSAPWAREVFLSEGYVA